MILKQNLLTLEIQRIAYLFLVQIRGHFYWFLSYLTNRGGNIDTGKAPTKIVLFAWTPIQTVISEL